MHMTTPKICTKNTNTSINQTKLTIPNINPSIPLKLIIHKSSLVGVPAIIHHLPLAVTLAVRVEVAGVASRIAVVGEAWHSFLFSGGVGENVLCSLRSPAWLATVIEDGGTNVGGWAEERVEGRRNLVKRVEPSER